MSIAITRSNPDGTSAIHGITLDDVAEQPAFGAIAGQIEQILEDADIAGYNVSNDIFTEP